MKTTTCLVDRCERIYIFYFYPSGEREETSSFPCLPSPIPTSSFFISLSNNGRRILQTGGGGAAAHQAHILRQRQAHAIRRHSRSTTLTFPATSPTCMESAILRRLFLPLQMIGNVHLQAHCYVNAAAFVNVSGSWRLHCVCGSRTPRRPARAPSGAS